MVRGSSFRDKQDLIDIGVFNAERLVNMAQHSYSKETGVEPNLTFTPNGKWIIFSGNFDTNPNDGKTKATTHVYAVEVAKKYGTKGLYPANLKAHWDAPTETYIWTYSNWSMVE